MVERDIQKKIDVQNAKLAKLDEKIGQLMGQRVDAEEAIAALLKTREKADG